MEKTISVDGKEYKVPEGDFSYMALMVELLKKIEENTRKV